VTLDLTTARAHIDAAWDTHISETLHDYIRIPNVSPAYDPDWADAGHMARAVELIRTWCARQIDDGLTGATIEVQELPGRTPLLVIDIPATTDGPGDTVLLYGHLDKQPPFDGWRPELGPWEPVVQGERLYGRGSADDGYAAFAALTAIAAVREAGGAHHRCLVLIEASEESGSPDLPAHIEQLGAERLGEPSLVVALDSGCRDWDHLWFTTSLRGLADLFLRVEILTEGVHSGNAGNIVPSTFRILRQLLDRIEDPITGELTVPELHADIPELRRQQAEAAAPLTLDAVDEFPFVPGARPADGSEVELELARTWRPALEITGLDGAPLPTLAGNVLRPCTEAKLSLRLPPTVDAAAAQKALVERLADDPPYGARVTVESGSAEDGWHAPPEPDWLRQALDGASTEAFGGPPQAMGEGGSIPFVGMLGRSFPDAEFVITGLLGPGSNAHGPNEFLHLPTARRLTTALAHILNAHAQR
jgi:acetylornithine deacetylase/succinyl-diaminopimelate desuccinylase-like protein